jgi:predicted nucleic acid-binding protein
MSRPIRAWNVNSDPLPFDVAAARSYGRVYTLIRAAQRKGRGRLADLLMRPSPLRSQLPIYTRNPTDFAGLESLVNVVSI